MKTLNIKNISSVIFAIVVSILLSTQVSRAATAVYDTSTGKITGFTNLKIGAFMYNAFFRKGELDSIFPGDFDFNDLDSAEEASNILLAAILSELPGGTTPSVYYGCDNNNYCMMNTPYMLENEVYAFASGIDHTNSTVPTIYGRRNPVYRTIERKSITFVDWELVGPVPTESYFQIKNRWKSNQYINIESGSIKSSTTQPGWHSAQWVVEKVPNSSFVKFKNRWIPEQYIHIENGKLESSIIQPGWHSAQWTVEKVPGASFVRLNNRWKSNQYIHIENGKLESSWLHEGAHSAQWLLEGDL